MIMDGKSVDVYQDNIITLAIALSSCNTDSTLSKIKTTRVHFSFRICESEMTTATTRHHIIFADDIGIRYRYDCQRK